MLNPSTVDQYRVEVADFGCGQVGDFVKLNFFRNERLDFVSGVLSELINKKTSKAVKPWKSSSRLGK